VVARTKDAVRTVGHRRLELSPGHRGVEAVSEVVAQMKRKDEAYEFFGDLLADTTFSRRVAVTTAIRSS